MFCLKTCRLVKSRLSDSYGEVEMISLMDAHGRGRKSLQAGRSKKDRLSLSIETALKRSREASIIEARKRKIERLGVTEWGIWKFLHIQWE